MISLTRTFYEDYRVFDGEMLMKGIDIEDLFRRISSERTLNLMEAMIINNETKQMDTERQPLLRETLLTQFRKNGKVTKSEYDTKLYQDGENKPPIPKQQYFDPSKGFGDIAPVN